MCFWQLSAQLRGGQRPGAVGVRAVQRHRRVLRLFRGDAGTAADPGQRVGGRSQSAGRRRVHAGAAAGRARSVHVVRGAAGQRPRLRHDLRPAAADEAVRSTPVSIAHSTTTATAARFITQLSSSSLKVHIIAIYFLGPLLLCPLPSFNARYIHTTHPSNHYHICP